MRFGWNSSMVPLIFRVRSSPFRFSRVFRSRPALVRHGLNW